MSRFFSPLVVLLLFVAALPLLLTGCATMRSGQENPTISVTNLRVQEVKPLEAVFLLELRVINPNDFSLDIRGISCDLKLDGNHFATGISNVRQKIPAFGTAILPVTLYGSMFDMVKSIIQMLQVEQEDSRNRPVHYELTGKISLGTATIRSLPFQTRGELNLGDQGGK